MPLVKKKLVKIPKEDMINSPPHYQAEQGLVETIDVIEAFELNFHIGNVVKYLLRADMKNDTPLEDLKKAAWYLARHLKHSHNKILTISEEGKVTLD